jgi:hypothetical protein
MSRQLEPRVGRRACQTSNRAPKRNPGRFVGLAFVAVVGVVAGTTLGATVSRIELLTPDGVASEKKPVAPGTSDEVGAGTASAKQQPRVEDVSKQGLAPRVSKPAALPSGSSRFGTDATAVTVVKKQPPTNRLKKRAKIDMARTASIFSSAENVEIAETEAEVIEIESRLSALGSEHFKVPAGSVIPIETEPANPDLKNRTTAKYVNLRAGPDNDAKTLAIVPANTDILAEDNCLHWCGAVYQGQKGYIYKTFIRKTK